MIRGFGVWVGAAVLVTACLPAQSPPRVKTFHAPPQPRTAAFPQPEFRGYRLARSFLEKSAFHDGAPLRTGALLGGLRMRTDASGLSLADSIAEPALTGGTQLPEQLGGGLLFWNNTALYTADTFLGVLKPLLDIGYRPSSAAFGPTFVLLRNGAGKRIAIDLRTRQRVQPSPPLLVDVAATADGRAVALLEGGKCALSVDGGKTYAPLALPAGDHATTVRVAGTTLLVNLAANGLLRLEPGSAPFVDAKGETAAPKPRADSLWPPGEPPIERALRAGTPIGEEFAGVAVAGSVATVNLRTGELVQMTRALVPSDVECRTLDATGGLLLACTSGKHGTIVLSDVFGEHPVTQAKFPAGVAVGFADGVLIAASRCDGEARLGSVCVRASDGHFRDYDVSAKLTALAQGAPPAAPGAKANSAQIAISRWIPKEGGGAVAVVNGKITGFLDAQSSAFIPLGADVPRAALEPRHGADAWLGLDWIALRDGSVRGWQQLSSIAIAPDGRMEPNVYEFHALVVAGTHALAFDKGRHAFQSSDWGHSWVETLAPPGSASGTVGMTSARCSAVGCHLGPWLRVGWEPTVPAALSRAQVAAAPPRNARAALPTLVCTERAPPVVVEAPHLAGNKELEDPSFGFGAAVPPAPADAYAGFFSWAIVHPFAPGPDVGLRAGVVARVPPAIAGSELPEKNWPGYAQNKAYSFVAAFDPSARTKAVSVSLRALFDAAVLAGAEPPSLEVEAGAMFTALPVLGREPGQAEGLLLDDGSPVWVHDSGPADAFSLGPKSGDATVVSAFARGPHTLALLAAREDGSVDVTEISAGKARRLFQIPDLAPALYPENADALASGPRGALAVLRTRSGSEAPTDADPAVLIDESGVTTVLAPWSRLFLADAPECRAAPNDYRAVLQTSSAWLALVNGGAPTSEDERDMGMLALIRANPDRICLEAVELAQKTVERANGEVPTHVTARFVGPGKGAAKVGFGPGLELRQPLDCVLSTPR